MLPRVFLDGADLDLTLTDRVRLALALADTSARNRSEAEILPEHLLHGLLMEGSGESARILRRLGVDPAGLCAELEETLPRLPTLPLSGDAQETLARALRVTEELGEARTGSAVLLLALLEAGGVSSRLLEDSGLSPANVRREVLELRHGRRPFEEGGARVLCRCVLGLDGPVEALALRSRDETVDSLAERLLARHENVLRSYLSLAAGRRLARGELVVRILDGEDRPVPASCPVLDVPGESGAELRWTARVEGASPTGGMVEVGSTG
jgi:ATP-dependent Clp protease ATP-binding subunit ClpA